MVWKEWLGSSGLLRVKRERVGQIEEGIVKYRGTRT